jgi:CRISPR type III-A-associated protein Csm2
MAKGKITRIAEGRGFFFIDNDYWCHNNSYSKQPEIGDIVEYTPEIRTDGKKNAKNVRFIKKGFSPLDYYFEELESGYFIDDKNQNLKPQLIIQYPKQLAEIFQKDKKNKPAQIRKYFDSCRLIEGKFKLNNDFNYVISELLKLVPLLNNARGKDYISNDFYEFFEKNVIEAIKSKEHFQKGFIPHFESIIGYYKH